MSGQKARSAVFNVASPGIQVFFGNRDFRLSWPGRARP